MVIVWAAGRCENGASEEYCVSLTFAGRVGGNGAKCFVALFGIVEPPNSVMKPADTNGFGIVGFRFAGIDGKLANEGIWGIAFSNGWPVVSCGAYGVVALITGDARSDL